MFTIILVVGLFAALITYIQLVNKSDLKKKEQLQFGIHYKYGKHKSVVGKKLSDRMVLDVFGTTLYELVMQVQKEVEEEEKNKAEPKLYNTNML